jgi:FlaA1/EpsC-like NDP-sugar epimerase
MLAAVSSTPPGFAAVSSAPSMRASLSTEPVPEKLVAHVTGRTRSLFLDDLEAHWEQLSDFVRSSRFLVIGAAGSIGSAFVKQLLLFRPKSLVLVDISENALADLVRDLRSSDWPVPERFATSVVAFGDPGFIRFARRHAADVILDFAALKHVRSERDPFSLMRMIMTNALAVEDLYQAFAGRDGVRLFSVSSDKAVSPTNLMGATKRWMERILADHPDGVTTTSARFANVIFSNGSLPHAFLHRLARHQPLAAPDDVRRYFISHAEAGQLCLMAAMLGNTREVFLPRLDPRRNAIRMDEVARRVLEFYGMTPERCGSEEAAKGSPLLGQETPRAWPCWFAPSDTSGEKECEEFEYPDELLDQSRFGSINVALQAEPNRDALSRARARLLAIAREDEWSKEAITEAIRIAVPELAHVERYRSLDEKL